MTPRLILLVILTLCAACAPVIAPPAPLPVPAADPTDECPESETYLECLDRLEAAAIADQGARVTRDGLSLRIGLTSGSSRTLVDDTIEGARYTRYRYTRYIPVLRSHLVRIGYYEGGSYLLVDEENGGHDYVSGIPLVSPGGTRFLTTSLDLEAYYDPNTLQVWEIAALGPRLILGLDGGEEWGPSEARWVSENEIEFTRHTQAPNSVEHEVKRMRLVMDGDEIQVRALSP